MSDKFKPGDRVVGLLGWRYYGVGTVLKRRDDGIIEAYVVRFDKSESTGLNPYAKFIRKLTKLEKALR